MTNEQIGYCQRCGLLDHHLEHELCPQCLRITPMRNDDLDDLLGIEMTVDHVLPALLRAQAD